MANQIKFTANRTYATKANAVKAVEQSVFGGENEQRYFIMVDEATGRFFPVFVGERAVQAGVHFHFHVIN